MKPRAAILQSLRPLLPAFLLAAFLGGCSDSGQPFFPTGTRQTPPFPADPASTIRLLEWCYDHRAYQEYTELFTADYRFNAYGDVPFTREDELISTAKLFFGGDSCQAGATMIDLVFDRNFTITPNPYRANNRWHRLVTTAYALTITFTDGNQTEMRGLVDFGVVRGDSALIPDELLARGFEPDSNRWYIERWEDRTPGADSVAHKTWGALKRRCR
jgi:hypothetical protein